jgi:hypothetical protein
MARSHADFNRRVIIAHDVYDDDGDGERDIEFPATVEVCDVCDGAGRHVNPSIDGNGITSEDMAELGDDFREDYFSGAYDVQCRQCHGRNVMLVIDEKKANKIDLALYYATLDAAHAHAAERDAEIRMGA